MKVSFLTSNPNLNTGSYRIWVNDLSRTIKELGHESKIHVGKIDDANPGTIILCKSAYSQVDKIKNNFSNSLVGAINIPSDYHNKNIDFVIAGSYEEKCSLSFYNSVFVYPLIERKFEDVERKVHAEKDTLRICFHGHFPHLAKFEPFLKNAIEVLSSKIRSLELVIITGDPSFNWKLGKPNNVKIESHQYDQSTVSDIIKSCDIGVVPNVTDMRLYDRNLQNQTSVEYGLYDTDYFLRFKNKTNAGRAFVFYQHGIPVVHDLSPSSFEFMGKCERKVVAHDSASWYRELASLSNYSLRNEIAEENFKVFSEHYNPHNHAKKLLEFIRSI
tara:strand:- start:197 stop:1186 length:990 start_codon:yes stop_codon:yes gene_type:complete